MLATISTPTKRAAYAALAAALLTAAILVIARDGTLWQFFAFGAAPDLALFVGVGSGEYSPRGRDSLAGVRPEGETRGLAKGQLHPRAVPLYNALHRFIGPLILAFVPGLLVGALAWALHIAIDRAVGYGLRTPDGFQRA
jgi:uncharacterized protein DUF4260